MPATRPMLWALALLSIAASAARADWTLLTADFKTHPKATVNEWTKDGLSYTAESGKLTTVPTRELISLASDRSKAPANAKWLLLLRNGDLLQGEPAGMNKANIQFRLADVGTLEIPLKLVSILQRKDAKLPTPSLPSPGAPPVAADKDVLRLTTDTLEGIFLELDDNKLKFQSDLGESSINLASVERLALGGAIPPRGVPRLSLRLTFASGSTLTTKADRFRWTLNAVTFDDPSGEDRKCNANQLADVEVLGGRVVWLTELDPSKEDQSPAFGDRKIPAAINHSATIPPGPLKVAKQVFDRGIGVHTNDTLTYDLDGTFETLSLRAGVDDSAAPYGQADLTITLDGKILWQAKTMKAGELSPPLALPIKGGKKLELRATDPGQRFNVQGRADWLTPALIRP